METLVLASTIITGMARSSHPQQGQPLFDGLDNPWPALWTIVGTIAVAVLTGCVGSVTAP